MSSERRLIRLLDADPDLGEGLSKADFRAAHQHAVCAIRALPVGKWRSEAESFDRAGELGIGLLLLDGLLLRDVQIGNTGCAELLGAGDLLRPWDEDRSFSSAWVGVRWRALEPTSLAVLDRRFVAVACRWPSLIDRALGRSVQRSRSLAFQLAACRLKNLDVRLQYLLWHYAERWGRVGPDGVSLELPLTHEILARLACAQRPSVTSALGDLMRRGDVARRDGGWLLRGAPPPALEAVPTVSAA